MTRTRVVVTGLGTVSASGTDLDRFWTWLCDAPPAPVSTPVTDFDPRRWLTAKEVRRSDPFARYAVAASRLALADADLAPGSVSPTRSGVVLRHGLRRPRVVRCRSRGHGRRGPRGRVAVPHRRVLRERGTGHGLGRRGLARPVQGHRERLRQRHPRRGRWRRSHPFRPLHDRAWPAAPKGPSLPCSWPPTGTCGCSPTAVGSARSTAVETASSSPKVRPCSCSRNSAPPRPEEPGSTPRCSAPATPTTPAPWSAPPAPAPWSASPRHWPTPASTPPTSSTSTPTAPAPCSTTCVRPKPSTRSSARPPPVTSIKRVLGHAAGASGAFEAVAAALTVHHGVMPSLGTDVDPDPELDLPLVTGQSQPMEPGPVLSNSFGLGGHNGCLIVGPVG